MTVKTENGAEFLMEQARAEGIACSTVKDGHVLIVSEKKLKELAALSEKSGFVILLVKRPDFVQ